jgi:hypothetical protein
LFSLSSSIYIAQISHALSQKSYSSIVLDEQQRLLSIDYFTDFFLQYFPIFFICPLAFFGYKKGGDKKVLFLATPFILIALSLIINNFWIPIVLFSLVRNLFAFHTVLLYSTALLAVILPVAFENISNNVKLPDINHFINALWISVVLYCLVFLFLAWSDPSHVFYWQTLGFPVEYTQGIDFNRGIFSYEPNPEIAEILDWINNADFNERVIIENDFDYKNNMRFFSSAPIYLHDSKYRKFFIGGSSSTSLIVNGRDYEVFRGTAFGKPITDYSYEEFSEKLNIINVRYLIVWSEEFRTFLDGSDRFEKTFDSSCNMFSIYEYKECHSSYIISNVSGTVFFDHIDRFRVVFDNVSQGENVTLSLNYFPEFYSVVYQRNRTTLYPELFMDDATGFLSFETPIPGSYTVDIIYTNSIIDTIARNLTILTLFLIVIKIVSERFKLPLL